VLVPFPTGVGVISALATFPFSHPSTGAMSKPLILLPFRVTVLPFFSFLPGPEPRRLFKSKYGASISPSFSSLAMTFSTRISLLLKVHPDSHFQMGHLHPGETTSKNVRRLDPSVFRRFPPPNLLRPGSNPRQSPLLSLPPSPELWYSSKQDGVEVNMWRRALFLPSSLCLHLPSPAF